VEISIEETEIVVEMEIGVADLMAFHNLLPDEMRAQMGLDAAPLGERERTSSSAPTAALPCQAV
jgi:hypothetical protein